MAKIALVFSLATIFFSFCTVLFSFFHFQWKNKQSLLNIEIAHQPSIQKPNSFKVLLSQAIMPILGNVTIKFTDKNYFATQSISLNRTIEKSFFSLGAGVEAHTTIDLPHIQTYDFNSAIISFSDMLSFFKFSTIQNCTHQFKNLPQASSLDSSELIPMKTDKETKRIAQYKKVENDWLNYKKFESSDDVRRIVWKVFAKHKELMLRAPEMVEPYASKIYMYASFYNSFSFLTDLDYQRMMLNRFKEITWSVFKNSLDKHIDITLINDSLNATPLHHAMQVQAYVTQANWQNEYPLQSYMKSKNASLICLHSMMDAKDVKQILESLNTQSHIIFVCFSKQFQSNFIKYWTINLLFRPKKNLLIGLKSKWHIQPLKYKILNQEKALLEILKQSPITLTIL
jgi:hypothetical protein